MNLIERIEGAEAGSRELDAEIIKLVSKGALAGEYWHLPSYSSSLDAAMSLVPEGWTGLIPVRGGQLEEAWLWPCDGSMAKGHRVTAATPALALCAAALRAIEAGEHKP